MNIVFYVLMTMLAVYAVFHIKDVFFWWLDKMLIVPKAIWKKIKRIFRKG